MHSDRLSFFFFFCQSETMLTGRWGSYTVRIARRSELAGCPHKLSAAFLHLSGGSRIHGGDSWCGAQGWVEVSANNYSCVDVNVCMQVGEWWREGKKKDINITFLLSWDWSSMYMFVLFVHLVSQENSAEWELERLEHYLVMEHIMIMVHSRAVIHAIQAKPQQLKWRFQRSHNYYFSTVFNLTI